VGFVRKATAAKKKEKGGDTVALQGTSAEETDRVKKVKKLLDGESLTRPRLGQRGNRETAPTATHVYTITVGGRRGGLGRTHECPKKRAKGPITGLSLRTRIQKSGALGDTLIMGVSETHRRVEAAGKHLASPSTKWCSDEEKKTGHSQSKLFSGNEKTEGAGKQP